MGPELDGSAHARGSMPPLTAPLGHRWDCVVANSREITGEPHADSPKSQVRLECLRVTIRGSLRRLQRAALSISFLVPASQNMTGDALWRRRTPSLLKPLLGEGVPNILIPFIEISQIFHLQLFLGPGCHQIFQVRLKLVKAMLRLFGKDPS